MRHILLIGRLSQSVTSLAISADSINALQIRDILEQLPNLNGLSLSGSLVTMDRDLLRGIGTVLRGNFDGQLRLLKRHAIPDVMNMLLEVPTGLHFSEVDVLCTHECLLPTVRLTEACGENLIKLNYSVDSFCKSHPIISRRGCVPKLSQLRWPRGFGQVLRLFQVPEPTRSKLGTPLAPLGPTLDPRGSFNNQIRHLSKLIRYQTQLRWPT